MNKDCCILFQFPWEPLAWFGSSWTKSPFGNFAKKRKITALVQKRKFFHQILHKPISTDGILMEQTPTWQKSKPIQGQTFGLPLKSECGQAAYEILDVIEATACISPIRNPKSATTYLEVQIENGSYLKHGHSFHTPFKSNWNPKFIFQVISDSLFSMRYAFPDLFKDAHFLIYYGSLIPCINPRNI